MFKNPIESTKGEFKDCWPPQEVLYWTHSMNYTIPIHPFIQCLMCQALCELDPCPDPNASNLVEGSV